jgi:hypothetical protein
MSSYDEVLIGFSPSLLFVYVIFYCIAYLMVRGRKYVSSDLVKTIVYYPAIGLLIIIPTTGLVSNVSSLFLK